MSFQLEITREAKLDIQEAWLWYEERKSGLGDDFALNVEALFEQIKKRPLLFEEKHTNFHIGLIKRFPYKVIYTIQNNIIVVIGVLHNSRNPTIWKDRSA